ncbi:MAG: hypothetical protein VKP62_10135 [Candidatus Sericytochromatia bacterium]|nr:hypothetical protein [Candidatus Sericytochromatia bacterium]
MAMHHAAPQAGNPGGGQQVFKPRASVYKFQSYYPLIAAGLVVAVAAGAAIAYGLRAWLPLWWMIPLFMAFPAVSVGVGAIYAQRLTRSRIVLDGERLRIFSGQNLEANIPWSHITRLTVRRERNQEIFEIWLRDQPVQLPVAFFEQGEGLLQAVSARTRRPWERPRARA